MESTVKISFRSLATISFALDGYREIYDKLPGLEIVKSELYNVHLQVNNALREAGHFPGTVTAYEGN
jgi:hypothetical protein